MKLLFSSLLATSLFCGLTARAETECTGTGDLRGFRYMGELIDLTSAIRISSPDGSQTGQAQLQSAGRTGARQVFTGNIGFGAPAAGGGGGRGGRGGGGGPNLRVQLEDTASDTVTFDIQASANAAVPLDGIYYWFNLPGNAFFNGTAEFVPADAPTPSKIPLVTQPTGTARYADATVKSIRFTGTNNRVLELTFANPTHIVIQETRNAGRGSRGGAGGATTQAVPSGPPASYNLYFPIGTGTLDPAAPFHAAFTLKATCDLDTAPVKLTLDSARTGPGFIGIGGNFRIQSQADSAAIAYNLDHFRLAWARLEMPLSNWQTSETGDPTAGPVDSKVQQAMEMARTLAQKKIPMIISDWSLPTWARAAAPTGGRGAGGGAGGGGGGAGGSVAPEKWPAMYKGITSYIAYMKKNYGAEPALFSFNEADQGINVKLTPEDHCRVIKELGAALAAQGLATKMLLGDTGNPTARPANFIDVAVADAEAMKYVGAISYHCWTGGSDQVIARWGQVAQSFKIPLMIGEGGTDPASYRYRSLFLEPWYALDEINLYLRCMALSQPVSILHWQMTDDYSLLTGGRNGQPLQPTQRFYNLQQLNLTPPEAPWLALASDRPRITAAAYGDDAHGYAVHLINTGATRAVTVSGLPASLKQLYVTVTDGTRNMKLLDSLPVANGNVTITLDMQSFATLTSTKP